MSFKDILFAAMGVAILAAVVRDFRNGASPTLFGTLDGQGRPAFYIAFLVVRALTGAACLAIALHAAVTTLGIGDS